MDEVVKARSRRASRQGRNRRTKKRKIFLFSVFGSGAHDRTWHRRCRRCRRRASCCAFFISDAADVQRLAGNERIAFATKNVPHPYEDGMTEAWIATHEPQKLRIFAITFQGHLVGAIGLTIDVREVIAELGYWVGVPHWGKGYCTEAAREVVRHGSAIGLQRIFAHHIATNLACKRSA